MSLANRGRFRDFGEIAMKRRLIAGLILTLVFGTPASGQQLYSNEQGTGSDRCRTISADKMRSDPSYARELAWDRMMFGDRPHPCGVTLQAFDPGTWERTKPLKASDSAGRTSSFRLYVLDERFSWALGSASELEARGTDDVSFRNIFSRELFLNEFCSANSVVGIGTASREGAADLNRRLAGRRALTVASELRKVGTLCESAKAPPIFELNLGKHKDASGCTAASNCSGTTSPQRRLVIVAAEEVSPGSNLEEALQDILQRTRIINTFAVEDYHEFIVRKHPASQGRS